MPKYIETYCNDRVYVGDLVYLNKFQNSKWRLIEYNYFETKLEKAMEPGALGPPEIINRRPSGDFILANVCQLCGKKLKGKYLYKDYCFTCNKHLK